MTTSRCTNYKGYRITTRWAELHVCDLRQIKRFEAAFAVHRGAPAQEDWQQFLSAVFSTAGAAESGALAAAKRSIDELSLVRFAEPAVSEAANAAQAPS